MATYDRQCKKTLRSDFTDVPFTILKAVKSTLKGVVHRTASRMPDLAWLFR